jgi:3-oxoadipate enol-lactonase
MPLIRRPGQPTLHYAFDDFTDEWKNAPVIILQHGFGRSSNLWYRWVPYLSRYFKVVRPNLRGLGQSPVDFDPLTGYSPEALLEDILAVIDEVSPGVPVHYCGESIGGIVGILLASERPERVRTLSLVSTPFTIPKHTQDVFALDYPSWQDAMRGLGSEKWTAATNGSTRFPPGTDPGLQAWYAKDMGQSDVESLVGLSLAAAKFDVTEQASRIRVPTLGLYPGNGTITRFDQERVGKTIPGIQMVLLPTEYHSVQFFMASQCARQVLHFASQHDGTLCDE